MPSPSPRFTVGAIVMLLWLTQGAPAAEPHLVRDIGSGTVKPYEEWLMPAEFVASAGRVFFSAADLQHGRELWACDPEGDAFLVKDIYPGANATYPLPGRPTHNANPGGLIDLGGILLFFADDGSHGLELWRSDGTSEGTWMVKDIYPGGAAGITPSSTAQPWGNISVLRWNAAVLGNALYFAADDGAAGRELWRSDGTSEGTIRLADLTPGSVGGAPAYLAAMGGYLYFSAQHTSSGDHELWRSNGSADDATRVADIRAGNSGSYPRHLTPVGSTLFFTADDGVAGRELWASDGLEARLVADIRPGAGSANPQLLTAVGDSLYFIADDGALGFELWRSDGSTASLVADIRPGALSSEPDQLAALGNQLVFIANDGATGLEPWRADATGATRLKDIRPNSAGALVHAEGTCARFIAILGERAFLAANSANAGKELWSTDGTTAGTQLVKEVGSDSLHLRDIAAAGGRVWFGSPRELWRSDGGADGTMLAAPPVEQPGSWPRCLTELAGALYFTADDEDHGAELWRSDGGLPGTSILKDIQVDAFNSGADPAGLTRFGDRFLFGFATSFHQDGVWASDGTPGGTEELKTDVGATGPFICAGPRAFCAGLDNQSLWVTDGTGPGTAKLRDHGAAARILKMTSFQDSLYYTADDDVIWRSDGTAPGTLAAVTVFPSGGLDDLLAPAEWTVMGDEIFFCASNGASGYELWKTRGDNASTTRVADIQAGNGSATPDDLLAFGSALYFSARPGSWVGVGRELWRSDGSNAGTLMLKDLYPGIGESMPRDLTPCGGVFYFTAVTAENGRELWRSDGSIEGTFLVKDINPGPDGSCPHAFCAVPDRQWLAFAAFTPERGVELWMTNGTPGGTHRVSDINPGPAHANPADLRQAGPDLFFRAISPLGAELWAINLDELRLGETQNWKLY